MNSEGLVSLAYFEHVLWFDNIKCVSLKVNEIIICGIASLSYDFRKTWCVGADFSGHVFEKA